MLKITPAQKLKVLVAVSWVCLLIIQALWGERYLEPTGLATDSRGNVYLSLIDTYRAEACLQKVNPSGKRLWSQVYQGARLSGGEPQNMVRIASGAIYQIINEYGNNGSALTVLKYAPNGRRGWAKELSNQPYYKNFSLAGDDLEILGMDRNFASLKLNRLSPSGVGAESVLILNPFENKRTWYQRIKLGAFLAAEQPPQLEIIKLKPDGQTLASFAIASERWLGLDPTEAIYLAAFDGSQVTKYSATGKLLWRSRLERRWNRQYKEELKPDYLEFDQDQNVYFAGSAQLFTAQAPFYQTVYRKKPARYFDRRQYWRSRGGDRVFIAKVDSNGALTWTNHLVTNQSHPKVGGLAVDHAGNVYLTGNFTFLDAKQNLFLAKYNKRGKLVWVKRKYQIPGSLFYLGLVGVFLTISLLKKERVWKLELAVLLGLLLLFWVRL